MKFNEYKGLDLAQIAADVLGEWDARDTFHKSITTREGHPAFVFYEGPPSANGMPGIHHVMARTIKDVFCRYKTQQGYLVHRKAGWDTHGLPVELGVEKKLGITKEDIGRKISIEEYNRTCREAVMEFTGAWEDLTRKMGYWVNMDDPYITYDNKYIETLWWLLKQLFDKGLLYKGYTIQPYSPAAGTGLSTHELNQPGCYRDVKDTTCTAQFRIIRDAKSEKLFGDAEGPLYFLAWTTTPWTLPSNTALAVGPAIEYVKVKCRNPYTDEPQTVILAKDLVASYFTKKIEGSYQITGESWMGPELEGIRYEQLIPWVKPTGDAFRVIVDNIADCYNVLGHIHDLFNPIPGRFKDYISTPKPNMYQSLHTTVIGSQGIPFEVQIRTWEMHQTAEYGIAAHWKYKQHAGEGSEKEFEWVRRLLENQQDVEADDYIHSLKVDMFDDEVFVFTPKGKVISLPAGSTPIDFAYAIHSAVGNSMIGAKVNNRIASYDAPLHNGDIVEILTSKSAKGPSRDWLNICQSNQARVKIKQWFKREKREENIVRGKASFEAELRHAGVDPDILQNAEILPVILKKVSFECLDDMYAAIGYGGLTAAKAVGRIRDDLTKATRTLAPKPLARQGTPAVNSSGVIVEDIGSCMIKFSRCCTPVPGDEIIGFITKGYGVSVHRKDCPNARAALDPAQKGRWVKVTWAEAPDVMFSTSLEIEADDRDGLMLDVATILTSLRLRTSEMSARSVGGGTAIVCLRFGVHNLTELENVRTRLRGISGVHNVERGTE